MGREADNSSFASVKWWNVSFLFILFLEGNVYGAQDVFFFFFSLGGDGWEGVDRDRNVLRLRMFAVIRPRAPGLPRPVPCLSVSWLLCLSG